MHGLLIFTNHISVYEKDLSEQMNWNEISVRQQCVDWNVSYPSITGGFYSTQWYALNVNQIFMSSLIDQVEAL